MSRLLVVAARVGAVFILALGALALPKMGRDRTAESPATSVEAATRELPEPAVEATSTTINPFRVDRQLVPPEAGQPPAPDSGQVEPAPPTVAPPERPDWTVTGIAWAGSPVAIVEGVAGAPGSILLEVGDTVGELSVLEIGVDYVRVVQGDSTWTFGLNRGSRADSRQ